MSRSQRVKRISILTTVIILTAAVGFVFKIWEFIRSLGDAEAVGFAVVPLSSYFLTGFGFLLLLVWSVSRGAFRDIEAPKWRMMKLEQRYTEEEGGDPSVWQTEEKE